MSITKYKFPFRVGRKQGRAILDANGIEILLVNKGDEDLAKILCILCNQFYSNLKSNWKDLDINNNL